MSYSRWGGSNWYSYANAEGLVAQVKDGNEYDKAELREIMAANCWHFAHTF